MGDLATAGSREDGSGDLLLSAIPNLRDSLGKGLANYVCYICKCFAIHGNDVQFSISLSRNKFILEHSDSHLLSGWLWPHLGCNSGAEQLQPKSHGQPSSENVLSVPLVFCPLIRVQPSGPLLHAALLCFFAFSQTLVAPAARHLRYTIPLTLLGSRGFDSSYCTCDRCLNPSTITRSA